MLGYQRVLDYFPSDSVWAAKALNQMGEIYQILHRDDRAKACYENSGFRLEGRLRHDHFHKGAFRDALIMSILKEEFGGRSDA